MTSQTVSLNVFEIRSEHMSVDENRKISPQKLERSNCHPGNKLVILEINCKYSSNLVPALDSALQVCSFFCTVATHSYLPNVLKKIVKCSKDYIMKLFLK